MFADGEKKRVGNGRELELGSWKETCREGDEWHGGSYVSSGRMRKEVGREMVVIGVDAWKAWNVRVETEGEEREDPRSHESGLAAYPRLGAAGLGAVVLLLGRTSQTHWRCLTGVDSELQGGGRSARRHGGEVGKDA